MNEPVVRFVCFEMCGEAFAFDMEHLLEIVQIRPSEVKPCFTPVPFVRGIWTYRARAIYIIDVREFFHLPGAPQSAVSLSPPPVTAPAQNPDPAPPLPARGREAPDQDSREKRDKSILVVRIRGHVLGMFSDAVLQVVPLGACYQFPDLISTLPRRYFAGIIRIRDMLAIVLAIDEFMSDAELEALAGLKTAPQSP